MSTPRILAALGGRSPRTMAILAASVLSLALTMGGCSSSPGGSGNTDEATQQTAQQTSAQKDEKSDEQTVPEEPKGRADETSEDKTKDQAAENETSKDSSESSKPSAKDIEMSDRIKKAIDEIVEPFGEDVSVIFQLVDNPDVVVRSHDDVCMRSASMIKLCILSTLLQQVEDGTISLSDIHTLKASEAVGGAGSIQAGVGKTFTVDELAWHMIAESDNTATNVLIDMVGMSSVNDTAKKLGLKETSLERKMMDTQAISQGKDNYTSARDVATLLLMAGQGKLVSKEQSERAIGYLKDQTDNDGIAQSLPADIVFAHKTGSLEDVRHDGGIVYAERPYVLVVLAHLPEGTANTVAVKVSQVIEEALAS